jgi:hypothetical protein
MAPLWSAWHCVLGAPLALPAIWRYGRHDWSKTATLSSCTVYYDPQMGRKRPKGWIEAYAEPGQGCLPIQTNTAFAHVREYESYVTAAHLIDEQAANKRVQSTFSRVWPACLTPVSQVLPEADTSLVLALFNITIPNQDEKKRTPFPNAGDAVCLIFFDV